MPKRRFPAFSFFSGIIAVAALAQTASTPLAQRIGRYDLSKLNVQKAVHDGAGDMKYSALLNTKFVTGNLYFLHRGIINPHSGIGEHYHNRCEEMFVILDGEAEFTIDGRTSLIKGPAGVPDRMGHAHAIYNPTDKPVQWMNINVGMGPNYDALNLGDDRVGATLDKIPQFAVMRLDRNLLRARDAMDGGTGSVSYRRTLDPTVFSTPWAYMDQLLVPAGSTVGARWLPAISEVYYVMSGAGTVKIGDETANIQTGDAIPVDVGQARSFTQMGSEPLELLIIGVAKDMDAKIALLNAPPVGRGGGGRGAGRGPGRDN